MKAFSDNAIITARLNALGSVMILSRGGFAYDHDRGRMSGCETVLTMPDSFLQTIGQEIVDLDAIYMATDAADMSEYQRGKLETYRMALNSMIGADMVVVNG